VNFSVFPDDISGCVIDTFVINETVPGKQYLLAVFGKE
jgi:hypothetical protein